MMAVLLNSCSICSMTKIVIFLCHKFCTRFLGNLSKLLLLPLRNMGFNIFAIFCMNFWTRIAFPFLLIFHTDLKLIVNCIYNHCTAACCTAFENYSLLHWLPQCLLVDPVRVANSQSWPDWESESSLGQEVWRACGPRRACKPEDTLESKTLRRSPEERTCHAQLGRSDVGPCGTVQGTEYVTGNRRLNEHLLVWEPVQVDSRIYCYGLAINRGRDGSHGSSAWAKTDCALCCCWSGLPTVIKTSFYLMNHS